MQLSFERTWKSKSWRFSNGSTSLGGAQNAMTVSFPATFPVFTTSTAKVTSVSPTAPSASDTVAGCGVAPDHDSENDVYERPQPNGKRGVPVYHMYVRPSVGPLSPGNPACGRT
jgi:hypothetical protein